MWHKNCGCSSKYEDIRFAMQSIYQFATHTSGNQPTASSSTNLVNTLVRQATFSLRSETEELL